MNILTLYLENIPYSILLSGTLFEAKTKLLGIGNIINIIF